MLRGSGCRLSFKWSLSNDKKNEDILLGSYSVLFRLLIFMAKWPRRLFTSLVRTSSIFLTSRLPYLNAHAHCVVTIVTMRNYGYFHIAHAH